MEQQWPWTWALKDTQALDVEVDIRKWYSADLGTDGYEPLV